MQTIKEPDRASPWTSGPLQWSLATPDTTGCEKWLSSELDFKKT